MSKIEYTTVNRIASYLASFPAACNFEIIAHIRDTYGVNFQLPRWLYFIDCARGHI